MKRRMAKILVSVLAICILCVAFSACGEAKSYQIEEAEFARSVDVVALTQEICESYPVRTAGYFADPNATTILQAADYVFLTQFVNEQMVKLGYAALSGEDAASEACFQFFKFTDPYSGNTLKDGVNGIWTKPASGESKGDIWVIAAYDNSAGISVTDVDLSTGQMSSSRLGGEGAYGSATSVATAIAIADMLKDVELDYTVRFAFIDCSQYSNEGIRELCAAYDAPALAINLNRLGGGTYNYIYSAEVRTDFNDAFYSAANKVGGGTFAPVPADKHIVKAVLLDEQPNDYTHIGMYGDNLWLMTMGVPTVSFLSLDWGSNTNSFYTEIDGLDNVYNTSGDTFDNMIERLGGGDTGREKLSANLIGVANTVATMLAPANADVLDQVLATAAEQASAEAQSSHGGDTGTFVKLALVVVIVAAAITLTVVGRNKIADRQRKKLEEVRNNMANARPVKPRDDIFEGFSDNDRSDDDKHDDGDRKDPPDDDIFEM